MRKLNKRVLILTISYPPVLNSAARLFSELAEGLRERGFYVTVITTEPQRYVANNEKAVPKMEKLNGVEVFRLSAIPFPKHIPLFRGLEHFFVAFQYWFKGKFLTPYDVVVIYSPPLPLALAGIKLARKWKGKAIVNIQDLYPQTAIDLGLLKNRFLISLSRRMELWVYQNADFISVHSEGNREYVVACGANEEKVFVIPNWIDLEKYKPGPLKNSFRKKYRLENSFLVSYAGVMGFAQGVDDILKAAAILEKKIPFFSLILAGDGVKLGRLKKLSKELDLKRVYFLPHLPEEEYIHLLQASDICLVTLNKNLLTPVVPGKLQCIMAVGRPAICSTPPTSDAKRILENSEAGIWVNAGDYKALAEAILKLYRQPELRYKMGEKARLYAEEHFNREGCISQYIDLINGK